MPDVVVLDVQMPRVSGYVAARLLKDDWQTADIPIILLTSLDAASDRYWGVQTGAERYFTKDFEAPQLVAAVHEVMDAANAALKGRRIMRADPVELSDDDVLSRVCDLLDRKLFETSVAAEVTSLAATTHGFEESVAGVLEVLRRFVEYDLASVLLLEERTAYVAVAQETSQVQYSGMLNAAVDALSAVSDSTISVADLELRLADPGGFLGDEDDRGMATFLSMPLKGHGGAVIGLIALSSAVKNAFGETALSTLRLVDGPAALVIDNARLAGIGVSSTGS
jgi:DNA-binding LytR/AlgR family response regulator